MLIPAESTAASFDIFRLSDTSLDYLGYKKRNRESIRAQWKKHLDEKSEGLKLKAEGRGETGRMGKEQTQKTKKRRQVKE